MNSAHEKHEHPTTGTLPPVRPLAYCSRPRMRQRGPYITVTHTAGMLYTPQRHSRAKTLAQAQLILIQLHVRLIQKVIETVNNGCKGKACHSMTI